MPSHDTPRRNGAVLVILLAAQLLLMAGSVRDVEGVSILGQWALRLSAPFVALGERVGGGVRSTTTGTRDVLSARARNELLEAEIERLRGELAGHREAAAENLRLRRLLGMREELLPRSIAASIVTAVLDAQTQMIVVDRGQAHGVRPGCPAIAWGGAVGRVVGPVGHDQAKIWLITDPNSSVAGVVQRSRAMGLVRGRGRSRLALRYVPNYADLMHGDRVVTSGLDGLFPKGFGLGRISSVLQTPDGLQFVELEPELDFAALEEVLIVLEPAVSDADMPADRP